MPRAAARRSIPEQALSLKKYFRSRSKSASVSIGSKMSDKPHTASTLGDGARKCVHSGELNVQSAPRTIIPEFCNRRRELGEVASVDGLARAETSRHVFPYDPPRAEIADKVEPGPAE